MKKSFVYQSGFFVLMLVSLSFVSCGKNDVSSISAVPQKSNSVSTSEILENLKEQYDKQSEAAVQNVPQAADDVPQLIIENTAVGGASSSDGIDVDLTTLSSTMVYAEVFNMMISPESYFGKTIKMKGDFYAFRPVLPDGTVSGRNFYACVIADATACCQQGLEFVLKDESSYPAEGSEIIVSGIFSSYSDEYGNPYLYVKDAKIM